MELQESIEKLKEIREVAKTYGVVTISEGDSRAIDTVVAEVETKTYTAEEREKYGKYCAVQAYDDGFYMGYIENQRPSFDEWWSEFRRKEATK